MDEDSRVINLISTFVTLIIVLSVPVRFSFPSLHAYLSPTTSLKRFPIQGPIWDSDLDAQPSERSKIAPIPLDSITFVNTNLPPIGQLCTFFSPRELHLIRTEDDPSNVNETLERVGSQLKYLTLQLSYNPRPVRDFLGELFVVQHDYMSICMRCITASLDMASDKSLESIMILPPLWDEGVLAAVVSFISALSFQPLDRISFYVYSGTLGNIDWTGLDRQLASMAKNQSLERVVVYAIDDHQRSPLQVRPLIETAFQSFASLASLEVLMALESAAFSEFLTCIFSLLSTTSFVLKLILKIL